MQHVQEIGGGGGGTVLKQMRERSRDGREYVLDRAIGNYLN